MRTPRLSYLLALMFAAACSGNETTVVQVTVANVTVSAPASSVEVGLSLQFSAQAFDQSGSEVNGQSVTWSSNNTSVATVDSNGLATGVQAGTSQISATIGGASGELTLTVSAASCTTRTDVILSPGQYEVFRGDECLLLPAGTPGDLYRVAIARPTLVENASNTPSVTLSMAQVLTPAAASGAEPAPPPPAATARHDDLRGVLDGTRVMQHLEWMDATRAFHMQLRMRERDLGLSPSYLLPGATGPAAAPTALVDPPATDSMFLDLSCAPSSTKEPVTLIGFSDYLAVYQETAAFDTLAISAQAANELIGYYDSYTRDMAADYFGTIPDTDADGRIIVVTSPALGSGVAAAVYSGDFYQTSGCAGSNEGETIYFQTELLVNLDPPTGDPDYFALGVVAHETKHVISLYNGIQRGSPGPADFHELWIEEGTAEISQGMSSRVAWAATGGPALGQPINRTNILAAVQANGGSETKEMGGIIDVLAGTVRSLSAQPNSVITDPNGAPSGHSFYSSSWHFQRFLGDGFGDASEVMDSAFFRALTDENTPSGATGTVQVTGVADYEELFEEFVVAVSLHGTGFTAAHPIDTWDFVSAGSIFSNPNPPGDYPWPVTATETNDNPPVVQQWASFGTDSYTSNIGPSGVRFHDFRSLGTAAAQISVTGSNQPCDANNLQRCDVIIVTRID